MEVKVADLVWLWHAMFDGTRLCWCAHSRYYRTLAERGRRVGH
jgi:hypothetical protein